MAQLTDITPYLRLMVEKGGSDLFLSTGTTVRMKVQGKTVRVGDLILQPGAVRAIAHSIMSEEQRAAFEATLEMNLALSVGGVGRFRVNIFRQRNEVSMVVRHIKDLIASLAELGLPPVLHKLVMKPRGLILVVGATGSGKSTTLASMIDHRNQNSTGHILTIEDPLEFLHRHKNCVVNQREVGIDTLSYESALANAMREAPDVILIGEVRARETMEHAIAYADTGHLCLSTLHANNADQALDRIVSFFPDSAQRQLFTELSLNLRAVVSQRLIRGTDGGLVPAVEILVNSPYVAELIRNGKIHDIKAAIAEGSEHGMQTFDQSLFNLFRDGRISAEEAVQNADSSNDLSLKVRLADDERAGEPDNPFAVPEMGSLMAH